MSTRNLLIIILAIFLFAIIFWPGLYEYQQLTLGPISYPIKTNRITGATYIFTNNQWLETNGQKTNNPGDQRANAPIGGGPRSIDKREDHGDTNSNPTLSTFEPDTDAPLETFEPLDSTNR